MIYVFVLLLGLAGGAICVYVLIESKHRELKQLQAQQQELSGKHERKRKDLDARQIALDKQAESINRERSEFSARAVSYVDLQNESALIKRDFRNLEIACRKLKLDRDVQRATQEQLDQRSRELGSRYLKDTVHWVNANLSTNNYTASKQRLLDVIARCREIGFDVPKQEEDELQANLQTAFEKTVRAALEREEQARIKARIREEMKLERERDSVVQQAEMEKIAIQAALAKALSEAHDQHTVEIERLQARLAEAEARSQRAIAMAQLTKAGYVYVISNLGSFGDGVFKIGMTRRLEPLDRVRELGDASVPFPFDVHMMISSQDAPNLENTLHRTLHQRRINRINPRKEFFRTDIEAIRTIVEQEHGVVEYVADIEALEYRQSLIMPDEDQEFIEHVYEDIAAENRDSPLDEELE